MGTRHLIAVVLGGDFKIAQYGQWDGYPEGQGKDVLEFLRAMDRAKFVRSLERTTFIDPAEAQKLVDAAGGGDRWQKTYPHWSRDMGSDVLQFVQDSDGTQLLDRRAFASESLFCEWAYVIDLDTNTLEVYKGFNTTGRPAEGRFKDFPLEKKYEGQSQYYPISLVKTYQLAELPTDEEFLAELNPPDEEEAV